MQNALKELQDPAVQQQLKAMLEDPAFLESMKEYMEQITKDPQFEALKKQTEAMLENEGFVEQVTSKHAQAPAVAAIGACTNAYARASAMNVLGCSQMTKAFEEMGPGISQAAAALAAGSADAKSGDDDSGE